MASTAAITIYPYPKGIDNTQRFQVVRGTIAVTTGLYPPGGYSLSWASLSNVNSEMIYSIPANSSTPSSSGSVVPFDVDIKSSGDNIGAGGAGPSGFIYIWDSVTGNMHIFISNNGVSAVSGPLVELGGNVPGAVVNDNITFTAYFVRSN